MIEFPDKLDFLFTPSRYKIAYGGRGSAKSWSCARALLLQATWNPLRVLCAREYQNSIQESVHRLLSDQVAALGLQSNFEVLQSATRGNNGSEFIFAGLKTDTAKIKSTEGIDIVWVEEADKVSANSWDVLIPTVRKPGSEIWITFNPHLQNDATFQRFVVNPPPDAVVREINWRDNPWFPDELEKERLHCMNTDPDLYRHIWEGECLPAGDNQLIGMDEAYTAAERKYEPSEYEHAPKIIGVDVARYGGDRSVIVRRQGLKLMDDIITYKGISNMDLAARVAEIIDQWQPDAVFIDAGRGEGVIDRLLQLSYDVVGVNFGGMPTNTKYQNKRAQMWSDLADWIKGKGQIPRNTELIADISTPTYTYSNASNKFELESKERIKARGMKSPDLGDALALTFAFPVNTTRLRGVHRQQTMSSYDPYNNIPQSKCAHISDPYA